MFADCFFFFSFLFLSFLQQFLCCFILFIVHVECRSLCYFQYSMFTFDVRYFAPIIYSDSDLRISFLFSKYIRKAYTLQINDIHADGQAGRHIVKIRKYFLSKCWIIRNKNIFALADYDGLAHEFSPKNFHIPHGETHTHPCETNRPTEQTLQHKRLKRVN